MNFERIYLENYPALYRYAYAFVSDSIVAEEMIHNVFLNTIEKNERLLWQQPITGYLFRSVRNECLNHLKHEKVKINHALRVERVPVNMDNLSDSIQYKELQNRLQHAINSLPEKCRTIFHMSRYEDLSYIEIASQMNISIKTVEAQISKALKRLRIQLSDYLPVIFFILITPIS